VVYTGLRSDSIKNNASRNEARRIVAMRIIFTHIGCTLFTCDMYMCRLRHINDPVLSSLKMGGIRLLFYLMIALHVSGIIITHLQERKATVTTVSGNRYTVIGRVTFLLLNTTYILHPISLHKSDIIK
jgi:hypothetical protein